MKATGIVRRIDDLGRVVIPRDIRKNLGIREGDPLEIYIDELTNSVCFQLYKKSLLEDLRAMRDRVNNSLYDYKKERYINAAFERIIEVISNDRDE